MVLLAVCVMPAVLLIKVTFWYGVVMKGGLPLDVLPVIVGLWVVMGTTAVHGQFEIVNVVGAVTV